LRPDMPETKQHSIDVPSSQDPKPNSPTRLQETTFSLHFRVTLEATGVVVVAKRALEATVEVLGSNRAALTTASREGALGTAGGLNGGWGTRAGGGGAQGKICPTWLLRIGVDAHTMKD